MNFADFCRAHWPGRFTAPWEGDRERLAHQVDQLAGEGWASAHIVGRGEGASTLLAALAIRALAGDVVLAGLQAPTVAVVVTTQELARERARMIETMARDAAFALGLEGLSRRATEVWTASARMVGCFSHRELMHGACDGFDLVLVDDVPLADERLRRRRGVALMIFKDAA